LTKKLEHAERRAGELSETVAGLMQEVASLTQKLAEYDKQAAPERFDQITLILAETMVLPQAVSSEPNVLVIGRWRTTSGKSMYCAHWARFEGRSIPLPQRGEQRVVDLIPIPPQKYASDALLAGVRPVQAQVWVETAASGEKRRTKTTKRLYEAPARRPFGGVCIGGS